MTTTIQSAATTLRAPGVEFEFDEAQLAAVSFLARYSSRTLEAYRHDLRGFFQWATDNRIVALGANRAHIELFRAWMEDRGLAASTIDRRLSTVCGFYRFAHIDERIRSNPAQYARRPQVHPSDARTLDRSELGVFLFTAEQCNRDHAALAVLLGSNGLRVSEACATNIEDLGFERGHRTLRIGVLQFRTLFERPAERFAYLERDGVELMIQEGAGRRFRTAPLERPYGRGVNFQLRVEDVDAVHARAVEAGFDIVVPIEQRWYRVDVAVTSGRWRIAGPTEAGNRQFVVADADGYLWRPFSDLGVRSVA